MTVHRLASAVLVTAMAVVVTASAAEPKDQCYECHAALADAPSAQFRDDIHRSRGVTCAGCHGGDASSDDMERAMGTAAGFRGVPKGDSISTACAGCHADAQMLRKFGARLPADQFDQLTGSVHGRPSLTGKERVMQCTTCHGAHGITAVRDSRSPVSPLRIVQRCVECHSNATYMRSYDPSLPVDQMEKYRTSVHGKRFAGGDPRVATCVSCHGAHDVLGADDVRSHVYPTNVPRTCATCHSDSVLMSRYGIPWHQYDAYASSVHGVSLLQRNDLGAPACNSCHGNHGATPPGVESISQVCGSCHMLNAELFAKSPHKQAFDQRQLPECETCHGNHAIVAATNQLLGSDPDAVCSRCHTQRENVNGFRVAGLMRHLVDSLETDEEHARNLVDEAEQKGMEIAEAKFRLRDVRQARLETRTVVHAFNEDRFREVVDKGLKASASVAGEAQVAIDEYYLRRIGLGIATFIMTVLAVSLYLVIKRLERRNASGGTG